MSRERRNRHLGRGRVVRVENADGELAYRAEWTDAKGKRRRELISSDRRDAERQLSKLIRDRDLELAGVKNEEGLDRPFSELVQEYLADVAVRATERSLECRTQSLEMFRKSCRIRSTRDVTPTAVQTFMRQRVREGKAPQTINNDVVAIQACLNHAVRNGWLAVNPIARLRRLPHRGKERRSPRPLTEEECVKLLDVAVEFEGGPLQPRPLLLRALIETGARWGELTSTTWGDVRWLPGDLRLRSETTKNRSERCIPLAPPLLELLRAHADERGLGQTIGNEALIFTSPEGCAWGLSHNFRDWLYVVLKKAGIARKDAHGRVLHVHALRHTFATRLARAGVPLQQAAYLTGHRTLSVLMQIYTHLQTDDARAAVARLALPRSREPATKLPLDPAAQEDALPEAGVNRLASGS